MSSRLMRGSQRAVLCSAARSIGKKTFTHVFTLMLLFSCSFVTHIEDFFQPDFFSLDVYDSLLELAAHLISQGEAELSTQPLLVMGSMQGSPAGSKAAQGAAPQGYLST